MSIFRKQADFLDAGSVGYPTLEPEPVALELIHEEYDEWREEVAFTDNRNLHDIKEAIDLLYVTAQYLNECVGPDKAQKLFDIVHEHNMSKCIDGKLVKSAAGKVLKPTGFDKYSWLDKFKEIIFG
jgi:predicted HAD superfamily Cof-like phosphohydrolase